MNNERGSITLPCIIIAAIMLALASSLLVFTTREYEHTRSYVRSRQLRLLTLSTLEQAERFADGRQVLLEKIFGMVSFYQWISPIVVYYATVLTIMIVTRGTRKMNDNFR